MSSIYGDYVPRKDSELVSWCANFTVKVTANASKWEIPPEEIASLQNSYNAFVLLHKKANSPNKTTVIVAEKNAARKKLTGTIRALAGFRLKNPIITAAERIDIGLHVRNTTPTAIDVPKTRPELFIEAVDFRRLKVSFYDQGSTKKAKPYGINGAVIICAALNEPPKNHSALIHSVLATRTPYVIECTEAERGKTLYVAACWQNKKGQQGVWSEIVSAIVP